MKPIKQPIDQIICPECKIPYSFTRCRVTLWPEGKRTERCLSCAIHFSTTGEEPSQGTLV